MRNRHEKGALGALLIVAGAMLFTSSVLGQGSGVARVVEVIPSLKERAQAPSSCVKVFRQFMDYVRKKTPDIAQDEKAQVVYLTRDLKKAMAAKKAFEDSQALKNPGDKREYPDNGAFVGAWDYPSTYSRWFTNTSRHGCHRCALHLGQGYRLRRQSELEIFYLPKRRSELATG